MAQYPERTDDGRPAGSAAGDVGDAARRDIRIAARPKRDWRNYWLIPLAVVIVIGIALNAPPFRTLNSAEKFDAINQNTPVLDYVLIVAHILFGTVALVTVCLAMWPWLRRRHPAAHRWGFRLYIFSAMPAALLIVPVVYMHTGLPDDIGSDVKALFWFTSTLVAYIASRQGNEARLRRWMLYSFAVCTSVLWSQFVGGFVLTSASQFPHLMEVIGWADPLTNLLLVKWWMYYTERRAEKNSTRWNENANVHADGLSGASTTPIGDMIPHQGSAA